jgi:hypothetical protein
MSKATSKALATLRGLLRHARTGLVNRDEAGRHDARLWTTFLLSEYRRNAGAPKADARLMRQRAADTLQCLQSIQESQVCWFRWPALFQRFLATYGRRDIDAAEYRTAAA